MLPASVSSAGISSVQNRKSHQFHHKQIVDVNERTSEQIYLEIQRFESVHPYIYTVYDLIDNIADITLQEQLREQVVSIEGAVYKTFFCTPFFCCCRRVCEQSGMDVESSGSGSEVGRDRVDEFGENVTGALLFDADAHVGRVARRFFLFAYIFIRFDFRRTLQKRGRFRKSKLFAFDSRRGFDCARKSSNIQFCFFKKSVSFQFTDWVDGVVLVFAVESRESFQIALQYFKRMNAYRNLMDVPVYLVGTQVKCCLI